MCQCSWREVVVVVAVVVAVVVVVVVVVAVGLLRRVQMKRRKVKGTTLQLSLAVERREEKKFGLWVFVGQVVAC